MEFGNEGEGFKTSPRVGGGSVGGQSMAVLSEKLLVVREKLEVVAAVGVIVDGETGVADIGPLAVSVTRQGAGLGSKIMRALEAEHDITEVGVVSCRSSVLPWYSGRGYITYEELPIHEVP